MVVLVDLDDDDSPQNADSVSGLISRLKLVNGQQARRSVGTPSAFSAILTCYPVAVQLASFLDRNTLHALSRTCHQIRASMLQFRNQLREQSLRCSNDDFTSNDDGAGPVSGYQSWDVMGSHGVSSLHITSSKVGPCVRDMVGECRRCARVVCRNCIMKVPPTPMLPNRLRRLCPKCIRAPISELLESILSPSAESDQQLPVLSRACCSCADEVFICQPCGHAISSADVNYKRIWEWRTRYSTYLGGLGTGIGEGSAGVKCARDDRCLAAKDTDIDMDLGHADLGELGWWSEDPAVRAVLRTVAEAADAHAPSTADAAALAGWLDPAAGNSSAQLALERWEHAMADLGDTAGYNRQEIEGIGGVLCTKRKKRIRVPSTVEEHEDERANATYLNREARGEVRSWCGWCNRVVLGGKDLGDACSSP